MVNYVFSNQKANTKDTIFDFIHHLAVILFYKGYDTFAANAMALPAGDRIAVFIQYGVYGTGVFHFN